MDLLISYAILKTGIFPDELNDLGGGSTNRFKLRITSLTVGIHRVAATEQSLSMALIMR